MIAGWLGLTERQTVAAGPRAVSPAAYKVVAFVPDKDLHKVADAMFAAGAGQIGQYSQCSFRIPGTGTFFGSDATNPTLGQKGGAKKSVNCGSKSSAAADVLGGVIAALRKAHSYEEPAFDIYPLTPRSIEDARPGKSPGRAASASSATDAAGEVGQACAEDSAAASGADWWAIRPGPCSALAIVCGAGGDFVADAGRERADVLLTGEARFHDCLAAEAMGLACCCRAITPRNVPAWKNSPA